MDIMPVQLSKFLSKSRSMYKNIIISALRARQIIDDRVVEIDEVEDFDDSIQFSKPIIKKDESEKPMVQALEEYLNDEVEWRAPDLDDVESTDETKL